MASWNAWPVIYEINTWIWINDLSEKYGKPLTLASVPQEEWDVIAEYLADAVWLMGVWERSPAGVRIAARNETLLAEFRRALPDFSEKDIVGSPFCVRRYVVDEHLGGPAGLAAARTALDRRGIRLILDFVPNHVAPDHPWVFEHPEYFIGGNFEDLAREPNSFTEVDGRVYACGRDPYFPAWPDVLQLNVFHPELRAAVIETILSIAEQCDGVRSDMAMLVMNNIFEQTWGNRAGTRPAAEYWRELIRAVRERHRDFMFLAEAYWELEWELQQQGFNYCYDKKLYDRIVHQNAESLRLHLQADLAFQNRLLRFVENHDEPRAASILSPQVERAAAVTIATIPGAKLFYEGQFEGRKVKPPLFLGRRPAEPIDASLQGFYRRLLESIQLEGMRYGEWLLCERRGWPDNQSYLNLTSWCRRLGQDRYLVVLNLSDAAAQGRVRVPWDELRGRSWQLTDLLSGELYQRDGDEMEGAGLYVDLPPWGCHFLRLS